MGQEYLIDTNIVIYYLSNKIPENHLETIERAFRQSFNISIITKIELLGWKEISDAQQHLIEAFLEGANIIYIDEHITSEAIQIMQHRKMKLPDSVIGATAITYNMRLITRNTSDFEKNEGLNLYNPFD